MGAVYRARDPRLNRHVAIKLLRPGVVAEARARERLRFEAMAAAALDHPYICKIFEIGEHGDVLSLVMEHVVGETLDHRLRRGRMGVPEILRVASEIAEALQEAHARGILHRDLKPSNIMLTGQGHVKVMDFGLAKRLVDSAAAGGDVDSNVDTAARLTASGTILGTPGYMSPEQVKGLTLDVRSDIFSFGVILAEMLGGRHPFRRPSFAETLSAVLSEPPELGADVPHGWRGLLQRLLAKAVEDRYASIAEVRAALAHQAAAPEETVAQERGVSAASAWRRPARASALVAAILLLGLTVYLAVRFLGGPPSQAQGPASEPGVIRSIAVLPLDNHSGDPSQEYFAEGMTDELTAELASISRLRVISRGSAMQFKGDRRPPTPEIARVLDVDAIVEGSVLRVGDGVRITAQLIDARADRHLWAKSFQRSSRDVLALQDELASAIAREINVQLTPAEQSRLASARSVNPEAHDAYLKGRYFFNRPSDENLQKAIARFEEATRLDPTYAPALSGLSDAYLWAGYNEGFVTASEARPRAKAAAEEAIRLDERSAEGHTSLAVFKLFYEYDWEGCEIEFHRAIELNPSYAFAHDQFALGLAFQGRLDESVAESRHAAELDPLSPQVPVDAIFALAWQGNYEAAREQANRAAELDPTFFFAPFSHGWIDIQAGKVGDAIPHLRKAKTMESPAFVSAWLSYAYGASGDRARGMAEFEDLKKKSLRGVPTAFDTALVHLGQGDHERALGYLEEAHAADSQWLGWLRNDRIFDPLRSQRRFAALLKKLRF
jgi:serine/threonine-protein kinase